MQILQVKVKDLDGKEIKRKFKIIRAWTNITGHGVFLHADGTYGFKDGAPVQSLRDINKVIHDPIQLRAATNWWERIGEKQSRAFYDALEKRRRKQAGDFAELPGEDESDKDMILYRKIPTGEDPEEYPTPNTWMEMGFNKRPDWWGQASGIQFDDFLYIRHEDEEIGDDKLPQEILDAQRQLVEMNADFLNENEVIVRFVDDELYDEYGPLSVFKTTQKYAEAETAYVDEEKKIIFTGNKEPHSRILIKDLMIVSVNPLVLDQDPDVKTEGQDTEGQSAAPPSEF